MACPSTLISRSRCWSSPRNITAARRYFASQRSESNTLHFTYNLTHEVNAQPFDKVFGDLISKPFLANTHGDDAAVLLATPDLSRQLLDSTFMASFARSMKGNANTEHFHVLSAVVDSVAPPLGQRQTESLQGISVLRGRLDDILPKLWLPSPPRVKEDADAVAALTFSLGKTSLTLPLTRTTFHNHKTSTLLASQFTNDGVTPRLSHQIEKGSQNIDLAGLLGPSTLPTPSIWTPLVPLTPSRLVTNSFGNIIKGLDVDGTSVPASTELEEAVHTAFKLLPRQDANGGPVGVWALVLPQEQTSHHGYPDPSSFLKGGQNISDIAGESTQYIKEMYERGGRLYQILSGGGGWGAKKGLLSLDPQRRHFALSEEEELQGFLQSMNQSNFAPPGCRIQFFTPLDTPTQALRTMSSDIIFGVPGPSSRSSSSPDSTDQDRETSPLELHFGALSSQGLFVSDLDALGEKAEGSKDESKLNVPHSRISVGETSQKKGGMWSKLADGLTLAGRDLL